MLLRDGPGYALYFVIYDRLKRLLRVSNSNTFGSFQNS
jgi:hypothetical protein